MIARMVRIIITLVFLFTARTSLAVDPTHNWQSIETQHFYIHFASDSEELARKTARVAENAHNKLSPIIGWTPKDKTHLVISDQTETGSSMIYSLPIEGGEPEQLTYHNGKHWYPLPTVLMLSSKYCKYGFRQVVVGEYQLSLFLSQHPWSG